MALQWDPGTRFAETPYGYWVPVSSGGRPLSDFVSVMNPNGQGWQMIPREQLPQGFEPGMSLQQNPDGSFRAVPYSGSQPYDYYDYATGNGTTPQGGTGGGGGLPGSEPNNDTGGGGLPVSDPAGTPPQTGGSGGGLPPSDPLPGTTPGMPTVGQPNARAEIERLRLAGLLDNLSINPYQGLRAPDYGNGPGVPMTHNPMTGAQFGYRQNDYFGTWDPTMLQGGSNPYYNAPTSGGGSVPPPMQGPVILGPNGLPLGLL